MPAVSKAQHGFMGLVRGVKEGTTKLADVKNPKKVGEAAKSMSRESLREYTATRTGELPRHAKGKAPAAKARAARSA